MFFNTILVATMRMFPRHLVKLGYGESDDSYSIPSKR